MTRSLISLAALVLMATLVGACSPGGGGATPSPSASTSASAEPSSAAGPCPTAQPPALAAGEKRLVTIDTAKGSIAITIEADLSPIAAGNFVALAACGYYDGVVFHRIVPGFVIQGGDGQYGQVDAYDSGQIGTGGPGYTIQDEPVTTTYVRGTVAMARSGQPNSVGSQFFIVLDDNAATALADPQYNNYQIIGTVASGLDAVDAIAADAKGVEIPATPIAMNKITVSTP
jgi:cyclophilin family peptidyl-prolyl cis-trans isomerase